MPPKEASGGNGGGHKRILAQSHDGKQDHVPDYLRRISKEARVTIASVVDWHRFRAWEWDIEYDIEKLGAHGVAEWEAAEVIWNDVFFARPNKKVHGPNRYELLGRTDAGRTLKLIVHVSGERSMRVITGWRV